MNINRIRVYSLVKCVLVQIGRWISLFYFSKSKYHIFLFFPFYHIGGAERVHSEILSSIKDLKPLVFFTKQSKDKKFKHLFERNAYCVDISFFAERSWTSYICFGFISRMINRASQPIVFSSNSNFFYHMLRYLKREVYCMDLIHAFGGGIESVSLPHIAHLDQRIVVSEKVREDMIQQYALKRISPEYVSRIAVIENGVSVIKHYPRKERKASLVAIFVGRGSEEKRIELIGKAVSRLKKDGIPVKLIFIGNVIGHVDIADRENCIFAGEISDDRVLDEYYEKADLLILTSSYEGFPLVIMEGMVRGVVPITTDVGGISYHIKHNENGILIRSKNPERIVDSLVETISELNSDRNKLKKMSESAFEYAKRAFNSDQFSVSYQKLFNYPKIND